MGLRHRDRTSPASPALLGGAEGAQSQKPKRRIALFGLAFDLAFALDPEARRGRREAQRPREISGPYV